MKEMGRGENHYAIIMPHSKLISFVATQKPALALQSSMPGSLRAQTRSTTVRLALVFDVNGTMLRVQKVHELVPARHTVLGWDVPDIAARMKELVERGVRFEHFPGLPQDESGIWTSPSGAKIAWFKDPDGNTLSLTQF